MGTEKLIKFLDAPERLNTSSLPELENWVEKYPYFQTAHLLRVKNFQNVHAEIDQNILHLTAAYVSDRKVLYYLLHKLPENQDEKTGGGEFTLHERDYKESLQENISDTLHKQKDLYDLEPDHAIELIPGLAIDIRKEYGSGIELEDLEVGLGKNSVLRESDLLEIVEGVADETQLTDEEIDLSETPEAASFELDLEDEPESMEMEVPEKVDEIPEPEPAEKVVVDDQENALATPTSPAEEAPETYASEEELDQARYRSFTDWLDLVTPVEDSPAEPPADHTLQKEEDPIKLEIPYDISKLAKTSLPKSDSSDPKDEKMSLIERFIQYNPRIVPSDTSVPNVDISGESVKEHESFFTDTLARIYIKQGNYAKAIFAYEKLSLKYPEKSTYFAGQISEIKKLISKS